MIKETHFVKKQIFDVEISNKIEYWKLQKRLEDLYNGKLTEVLEEVCDKYVQANETYQLNTMEIDIGDIHINKLEDHFASSLKENFEKKLAELINNEANEDPKIIQKEKDPNKSKLELISHFLYTGRYIWPYDTEDIDPDGILEELIRYIPEKLKELFIKNVENKNFIKRFTQQFSFENIKKIIILLNSSFKAILNKTLTEIPKILTDHEISYNTSLYRSIVFTTLFENIGNKQIGKINEDIENTILTSLFRKNGLVKKYGLPSNSKNEEKLEPGNMDDKDSIFELASIKQSDIISEVTIRPDSKIQALEEENHTKELLFEEKFKFLIKFDSGIYDFCQEYRKELLYLNENSLNFIPDQQTIDILITNTVNEFIKKDSFRGNWKTNFVLTTIKSLIGTDQITTKEFVLSLYKRMEHEKSVSKNFTPELLRKLSFDLNLNPDQLLKYQHETKSISNESLKNIKSNVSEANIPAQNKLSSDDELRSKIQELYGSTNKEENTNIQISSEVHQNTGWNNHPDDTKTAILDGNDNIPTVNNIKNYAEKEQKHETIQNHENLSKEFTETFSTNKQIRETDVEAIELQECYIENAGLILLWPFISYFFDELGYIGNKEFKNEAYRNKAVYLLNYPISKTTEVPENKLVLNKILCGFPLNDALEKINPLNHDEEIQLNKLVESVIENWQILKNTSIEGFVNSFLVHKGVIRNVEKGWKLIINRESYDIIMDKLPWQISIIKLPWMIKPIFVEW